MHLTEPPFRVPQITSSVRLLCPRQRPATFSCWEVQRCKRFGDHYHPCRRGPCKCASADPGRTTPVTRTNQYCEPVHRGHPKAMGRRFYGGYWSAIPPVTAFEGVPTNLLAIGVDVSMRSCGNDPCQGCHERREEQEAQMGCTDLHARTFSSTCVSRRVAWRPWEEQPPRIAVSRKQRIFGCAQGVPVPSDWAQATATSWRL
jgi:hypothetical protein